MLNVASACGVFANSYISKVIVVSPATHFGPAKSKVQKRQKIYVRRRIPIDALAPRNPSRLRIAPGLDLVSEIRHWAQCHEITLYCALRQ